MAPTDVSGLDPQFGALAYYAYCVPTLPINNPAVRAVFDSCPAPIHITTAISPVATNQPLHFILYPNPVTSNSFQLAVTLPGNDIGNTGFAVQIFDDQGRLVSSSIIPSSSAGSNELNPEITFTAGAGIYFLRLSFGGESVMRKLVKIVNRQPKVNY